MPLIRNCCYIFGFVNTRIEVVVHYSKVLEKYSAQACRSAYELQESGQSTAEIARKIGTSKNQAQAMILSWGTYLYENKRHKKANPVDILMQI